MIQDRNCIYYRRKQNKFSPVVCNSKKKVLKNLQNRLFTDFCIDYWNQNPACKNTTLGYRLDKIKCIKTYAIPFFNSILLKDINSQKINQFLQKLTTRQTRYYKLARKNNRHYERNEFLAKGTIKIIRIAVLQPLQYLAQKATFPSMKRDWNKNCPVPEVQANAIYYKGMVSPRDIFSTQELELLINSKWTNQRAYMMFLVARYTGMRNGELRGLKIKSIHPDFIDIYQAYNNTEGVKATKNGIVRKFPIFPELYEKLQKYILSLPAKELREKEAFVFPSLVNPGKPVGASFANTFLTYQMQKLGIPKERFQSGILVTRSFHSLRHCMDTYLANKTTLPLTSISHLMGHSTQMVQHYSDHFSEELYANAAKILSNSDLWQNAITKNPDMAQKAGIAEIPASSGNLNSRGIPGLAENPNFDRKRNGIENSGIAENQNNIKNPEAAENSKTTEMPDIAENSGVQVDVIKCLTQLYAQLGLLLNQMNVQEQMPGIKLSCAAR